MTEPDTSDRSIRRTDGGQPTFDCNICGRRFHTEDLLVLHRGVRHTDEIDTAEQEAYREAYAAEERAIRSFRLRAIAILVLLYFGFLFLYVIYAS
ncbi:MAG: DNA-binding protein [Halobellus sp.]|uniref:DNA-binding protein n=1 Tax=Halobellus sp. TaxID=1979212 RepID=UPI0035D428FA